MPTTDAYQQGGRFVLTDADDIDDAQVSGEWLACRTPVEVRR